MGFPTLNIIPALGAQRLRRSLESTRYLFRAYYVDLTASWYLEILDPSGVALVSGVRMVSATPLLKPYRHLATLPDAGDLWVVGLTPGLTDPTKESLGVSDVVWFVPDDEAEGILGGLVDG